MFRGFDPQPLKKAEGNHQETNKSREQLMLYLCIKVYSVAWLESKFQLKKTGVQYLYIGFVARKSGG